MGGFRRAELSREQLVLWSPRLEDAVPVDHPVRLLDELSHGESFAATFREWESQYHRLEGQPPCHPRDVSGLCNSPAICNAKPRDSARVARSSAAWPCLRLPPLPCPLTRPRKVPPSVFLPSGIANG